MGLSDAALGIASRPWVVRLMEQVVRRGAVSQGDERRPAVALTFDDGPHPVFTPRVLDLLDENQAPATFFVVGRNVEKYPSIVREARRRGHDVGIHLYTHDRRTVYDPGRFDSEVRRCQSQLESILGEPARFLRFPYGNRGHQDPGRVFRHYGLICVHWTFSSLDGTARTPARIVKRVESGLRAGAIVLFHDALADDAAAHGRRYLPERDATTAALPEVLSRIRARGLSPVTMGNLPLRDYNPPR